METKEFEFKGFAMNGFVALFIEFAIIGLSIWSMAEFVLGKLSSPWLFVIGLLLACIFPIGFLSGNCYSCIYSLLCSPL